MNGKTAKLIRRVAKARGNTKPTYIRHLKQQWYLLNEQEKELKRIEYQNELDEYEQEIISRYEAKLEGKEKALSKKEQQLSGHEAKIFYLEKKTDFIKMQINHMGFMDRLKYLITGNLELKQSLEQWKQSR